MGTIAEKIDYTLKAVQDITAALSEKGFKMDEYVLKDYGNLIRRIGEVYGGRNAYETEYLDCPINIHPSFVELRNVYYIDAVKRIDVSIIDTTDTIQGFNNSKPEFNSIKELDAPALLSGLDSKIYSFFEPEKLKELDIKIEPTDTIDINGYNNTGALIIDATRKYGLKNTPATMSILPIPKTDTALVDILTDDKLINDISKNNIDTIVIEKRDEPELTNAIKINN